MQNLSALSTELLVPPARKTPSRDSIETAVLRRLGEIGGMVDALMASWHSSRQVLHARRWHRFQYHKPVVVTPLDDRTEEPAGPELLAMGRDISKGGISFAHDKPLSSRKVAVSFELDDGSYASIVTELKWCRFTRDANYQSGGQFLHTASIPVSDPNTWNRLPRA